MLKKLIPVAAAICLIALSIGTALAHEPREIEDYNLVVGFFHEPAFEGMMNGVSLRVTKIAEHGHGHETAEAMDHGAMGHDSMESEVPISVNMTTEVDDTGGVSVELTTEGWLWTPDNVDGEHVPGEGHAHIYVDGVKIDRVYGPSYYLEGLQPGEREVRVSLNANSHEELTYDGNAVDAISMVTIPETGHHAMHEESEEKPEAMAMESDEGHGHGEELITGVAGLENTVQVEVTHVPTGATRLMSLYAVFGEPGHYKADFIPTASGQYAFHFVGAIEGKLLDERFESGTGTFDDVQPAAVIQFPETAASTREIESAVRGALESAQQAQDAALAVAQDADTASSSASTATTLAIAGIVVGAIGIVVGGIGMVAGFRRRD